MKTEKKKVVLPLEEEFVHATAESSFFSCVSGKSKKKGKEKKENQPADNVMTQKREGRSKYKGSAAVSARDGDEEEEKKRIRRSWSFG